MTTGVREVVRRGPLQRGEATSDAGGTTIGDVVSQLSLAEHDRICYLYDYGDEWRFYAILKEMLDGEPSDRPPEIVEKKGETVNQYSPRG